MYAAYYFILRNHSYLCPRKFTLRVDNQALAWLKTYSTDQASIGRWIMALEKYHFRIEHRPRTQHRNADGLSKRTNDYKKRERQLNNLPPVAEKWNFLSQDEYDQLPLVPWFDAQGRVIPDHPKLPPYLKQAQETVKLARRCNRQPKTAKALRHDDMLKAPLPPLPTADFTLEIDRHPEYPEDWMEVTEECRQDYLLPTHIANVPSRTSYPLNGIERQALDGAPKYVRVLTCAINEINTELHEHANTVHGLGDILLAQNRDVHILAIKKLMEQESIDNEMFPENVRVFATNYYKQKNTYC